MKQKRIERIIRAYYRGAKEALDETIKQQKGDKRKLQQEYWFNSGKEWALSELAHELDVELYDEEFKLIEEL